ncbi:MAG: phosphatidate cytidylyltransferase [Fimbriimonadaceae bacterium]|nr:phosphatidate cytidylyltransferase [Fimbriimonadaceae bacterium]
MKTRVLTALALIPVVLAAVFVAHPLPLGLLLIAVSWIASAEIGSVASEKGEKPLLGPLCVLAAVVGLTAQAFDLIDLQLLNMEIAWVGTCLGLTIIGAAALTSQKPEKSSRLAIEFSSLWVAAPLCSLLALHSSAYGGSLWNCKSTILIPLFALWAGDSAAILAGKYLGKHLLAPKISPKKTVEGAVANFIFCILGAMLGGYIAGIPMVWSAVCGAAAGVFGQAGDLFQSAWKRKFDKKDSGSLLPGHGGILDRIDSLLFTAPVVALIITIYYWNTIVR